MKEDIRPHQRRQGQTQKAHPGRVVLTELLGARLGRSPTLTDEAAGEQVEVHPEGEKDEFKKKADPTVGHGREGGLVRISYFSPTLTTTE